MLKRITALWTILLAGAGVLLSFDISLAETVARDPATGSPKTVLHTQIRANNALTRVSAETIRRRSHGQRFVEFRGELAYFPGNTVIRHGFLGADGEPDQYEAVAYQAEFGIFGLVLGSIIPVPPRIGVYFWDDRTVSARTYRVNISKKQHERLMDYIAKARQDRKAFYLYTDNCVKFARGAALAIGLKAPEGTFRLPPIYVNMLRIANER